VKIVRISHLSCLSRIHGFRMRICITTSGPAVCARFEHLATALGGHSQVQRVHWRRATWVASAARRCGTSEYLIRFTGHPAAYFSSDKVIKSICSARSTSRASAGPALMEIQSLRVRLLTFC
jgi:hypothetical protein